VEIPSSVRPGCTIENATSGWMPTITVSASRSRVVCAMPRSVRVANESITSSALTSITTPRERRRPIFSASSSLGWIRSLSVGSA
jgi:hypothetical protein